MMSKINILTQLKKKNTRSKIISFKRVEQKVPSDIKLMKIENC